MADQTDADGDEATTPPQPFKKTIVSAAEFEDLEAKALEKLCDRFRSRNTDSVSVHSTMADLGTKDESVARRIFKRLRGIGAIEEPEHVPGMYSSRKPTYVVSPSIFEIAADRKAVMADARGPVDRVASAGRWLRSHPISSALFIGLIVLTAIITLLNQLAELIDRFRN